MAGLTTLRKLSNAISSALELEFPHMEEIKGSFLGSATEMSHLEKTELRTLWMSLLEDSWFSPGFFEMLRRLKSVIVEQSVVNSRV